MGLFFPDDPGYDLSVRQTGFNRYKQLLSLYFGGWFKVNLLTLAGAVPLAAGILFSVLSSSILLLIPCALLGGMLFGPFLAGMYDAVLRGLRDDPNHWWKNYKRSWKQNWKGSLLPGAILGLLLGMYAFMGMLFWWSQVPVGLGTVALYLLSGLVVLLLCTLYWPQLVLFQQSPLSRLQNAILFCAKYLWRVLGVALLQLAYWAVYFFFAPWTLLLLPIIGVWFVVFLSQFLIYDQLNQELQIEAQYRRAGMIPQVEIPDAAEEEGGEPEQ